jgi:hypothetical protein
MRYEPLDCGGNVNVFWNHDMLFEIIVEVSDIQPVGQVRGGLSGFDVVEDVNIRSGKQQRYCGRPGKKARMKMLRKMRVARFVWLQCVSGMRKQIVKKYQVEAGALRHMQDVLARFQWISLIQQYCTISPTHANGRSLNRVSSRLSQQCCDEKGCEGSFVS